MRRLAELNINEGGRPVTRPAPTLEVIDAFQRRYGLIFLESHLVLLRYSNGGHPELDTIKPDGRPNAATWAVSRFYYLDEDRIGPDSLWLAMDSWRPVLGNKALPFAGDEGGNQFFLDLNTSPPKVMICIHDEGFRTIEVAPSFESFIDALSIDPEMV